jgi:hypothetical protein
MEISTLAVTTATFIVYPKLASCDGDFKPQVKFTPVRFYTIAKFTFVAAMDTYTVLPTMAF